MKPFLVCYDYGQGGVWLYVRAESADALQRKYPSLTIFESPPAFWTDESERIARKSDPESDPFWRDWLKKFEKKD